MNDDDANQQLQFFFTSLLRMKKPERKAEAKKAETCDNKWAIGTYAFMSSLLLWEKLLWTRASLDLVSCRKLKQSQSNRESGCNNHHHNHRNYDQRLRYRVETFIILTFSSCI